MNQTLIAVLTALAIVVVLLRIRATRKRQELVKELQDFARVNGAKISEYDCWKGLNTLTKLGVDTQTRQLFFIRSVQGSVSTFFVSLDDIRKVSKDYHQRSMGEGKERSTVIDLIGLRISYLDSKKKEDFLEFFNTDHDHLRVDGEMQLADKWEDSLTHLIGLKS